jgi:transposase
MDVRVSDEEWEFIRHFLSKPPVKKSWQGRPRADDRQIFEGIMWVLLTAGRWQDMPKIYPAKSSCHRRFQTWSRDGSLLRLQQGLVRALHKKRRLNFEEGFTDTSFIKAKKGGPWPTMDVGEKVVRSLSLSRHMDYRLQSS